MRKILLTSVPATMVALFLVSASAEESTDIESTPVAKSTTEAVATDTAAANLSAKDDIMQQPVDFSSPENVKKTLQAIRQQAGEKQASGVQNAMDYLIVYDLSIKRDKNKLYTKLNGKTPNEILGMTRR